MWKIGIQMKSWFTPPDLDGPMFWAWDATMESTSATWTVPNNSVHGFVHSGILPIRLGQDGGMNEPQVGQKEGR